jgi:hypothetical protein
VLKLPPSLERSIASEVRRVVDPRSVVASSQCDRSIDRVDDELANVLTVTEEVEVVIVENAEKVFDV